MNPTFAFESGVLRISAPSADMRLQWRPNPIAEHRLPHGKWAAFRPEFRILAPESPVEATHGSAEQREALAAKGEAFQAFRTEIPPATVGVAEAFGCCQWALMLLAGECQAGLDLARSNPVLAYALANNEHLRSTPSVAAVFQAVRYCHRKQRQILKWLGFPESEAAVKVMKKVPPAIAHPSLIRLLRQAVAVPEILKRMGHLPVINRGIVFLLHNPALAALASPALLHEVAGAKNELDEAPTADLLLDIHRMAAEMRTTADLQPFGTRRQVRECYDRVFTLYHNAQRRLLLEAQQEVALRTMRQRERSQAAEEGMERMRLLAEGKREKARRRDQVPFAPPPIPGTKTIIPLLKGQDLKEEAEAQKNCLGTNLSYRNQVMDGAIYIYRVMAPERCTLAIARCAGNSWRIAELKGFRNSQVSPAARAHVIAWLSAHQVSL
jgi:hypothetical protein